MPKQLKSLLKILAILIVIVVLFNALQIDKYFMKKLYPKEYEEYVYSYSAQNNIDPLLVFSIIKAESNFNHNAISNSNAHRTYAIIRKNCSRSYD